MPEIPPTLPPAPEDDPLVRQRGLYLQEKIDEPIAFLQKGIALLLARDLRFGRVFSFVT